MSALYRWAYHARHPCPGRYASREAQYQRYAQESHAGARRRNSVMEKLFAMIAHENDDGVFTEFPEIQSIEEVSDGLIGEGDLAVVEGDNVLLSRSGKAFIRAKPSTRSFIRNSGSKELPMGRRIPGRTYCRTGRRRERKVRVIVVYEDEKRVFPPGVYPLEGGPGCAVSDSSGGYRCNVVVGEAAVDPEDGVEGSRIHDRAGRVTAGCEDRGQSREPAPHRDFEKTRAMLRRVERRECACERKQRSTANSSGHIQTGFLRRPGGLSRGSCFYHSRSSRDGRTGRCRGR